MKGTVDQALYGYSEGHRLIASSVPIASQTNRHLRSLTDMAFDGEAESYLTCLPLVELGRYAVIKSWGAAEVSRPGAVWSHVLLVDFVDLSELDDPAGLVKLFARPEFDDDGQPRLVQYSEARRLPRAVRGSAPHAPQLSPELGRQALWAAYGDDETGGVVQVPSLNGAQEMLFAIWGQQWPRLRRSFAFRTRHRASEGSEVFDLQLVERLHRNQSGAKELKANEWLETLTGDLASPDRRLHAFLRRFGAESERGKADLPGLMNVWLKIESHADLRKVSAAVCSEFRKRQAMRKLKLDLLGPADQKRSLVHAEERERLSGILAARSAAIDLDELRFQPRLQRLWRSDREQAVELMLDLAHWKPSNKAALTLLLEAAVDNVSAADISVLASSDESLAIALMSQHPEFLVSPAVWRTSETFTEELLGLTHALDRSERLDVLIALLRNNSTSARDVLAQEPSLWWDAIEWGARSITEGRSWAKTVPVLHRALESVGPGGVGSAPPNLSDAGCVLLAVVASPSLGLWRQANASRWAEVTSSILDIPDRRIRIRGIIVLLAATALPTDRAVRIELWLAAFGPLHKALTEEEVDEGDLVILRGVLPQPDASWEGRLRKGLAKEIKKDRWDPRDIRKAVESVPPYRDEILRSLESKKKSKKSWVREVVDFFSP